MTIQELAIYHQLRAQMHARQAMWSHIGNNNRVHHDVARHHQRMADFHHERAWVFLLSLLLRDPII